MPVHHKAEAYLDAYLAAAGIAAEKDAPLWRSMPRGGGMGTRRMSRVDVFRMIKCRVKTIGLGEANCHTFRATGITAYLLNGGTLERAQAIAGAAQRTAVVEQIATSQPPKHESKPQAAQGRGVSRHPWEERKLRDDVLKVYNLRLPEPYLLKLKYIAEHTPGSMHQFCLDALLPAIDKKITKLIK